MIYSIDLETNDLLEVCIKQDAFINSLWPGDAIWGWKTVSTEAQVIIHYHNYCWPIIKSILWDFKRSAHEFNL